MKRPQSNPQKYLSRMEKGLEDKLFFLDALKDTDVDVFIDYGCADGVLLEAIAKKRPKAHLIGFDEDQQYLDQAKERLDPYGREREIMFSYDWDKIVERMFWYQDRGLKVALILSSVLHELTSYLPFDKLFDEYDNFCIGADYLIIRDMGIEYEKRTEPIPSHILHKVTGKADKYRLKSFLARYHRLSTAENFIHFLLKYPYKDNWPREMQEDYMLSVDHVWEDIEDRGYDVFWHSQYTHPYIRERVKKDFGFDLEYPTHFKFIAKRVDEASV